MSKKIVFALALAACGFTAACQKPQETIITPAPVSVEPVFQGKYSPT